MSAFSQMQDFRNNAVASLREAEETIEHLQQQRSADLDSIHEYVQHIDYLVLKHKEEVDRMQYSIEAHKRQYKELLTTYRAALDKYRAEARELRRRRC